MSARWTRLAKSPWMVLASLTAGVAVGHGAPRLGASLGVIGGFYLDLLKMVVAPFMVTVVIHSLHRLFSNRHSVVFLPRLLLVFGVMSFAAALVGLSAAMLVGPGRALSPDLLLSMGRLASTTRHDTVALHAPEVVAQARSLGEQIRALIPSNVFGSLAKDDTLRVLTFSLLFGMAAGRSRGRNRESLAEVLETVYKTCLELTNWFNLFLVPVLFAIVASQIAKTGLEPMRAMLKFILALGAGALLLAVLFLVAMRLASRRGWSEVLHSQREPVLMAVATRSSTACMPTMITSLVEGLGFTRGNTELLVPLGISLLRTGQSLYYAVATVFLAQLYDVRLGAARMAILVAGAAMTGMASSGMSGVVAVSMTGVVCGYLRLPFEGVLALFLAVDPVCDAMRTLVGVLGSNCFAAVAPGREPAEEV